MTRNIVYIIFGISIVIFGLLLTGATNDNGASQIGRYRLTVINRNNFPDLFIIDTTTGVVKWVGKDEGKPFEQIKGK